MKRSAVVKPAVVKPPDVKPPVITPRSPRRGRHAGGLSSPSFCLASASLLLASLGAPTFAPAQSQSDTQADETTAASIDLGEVTDLAAALEAIGIESGVTFRHRADPTTPIEVDQSPLTFWQALDAVLDQSSLDVDPYSGDGDVWRLTPRAPQRPPRGTSAVYFGQYRIEPQTVTARRELIRPRLSGLQVGMRLAWEPELAPIGLSVPIASVSGELDDGTAVVPQDAAGTIDIATNRSSFSADFFLPLQLPDSGSRQIRRLEGTIESMIPGDRGRFELALSDPVAEQTIGDMTVRIEGVRRQGELVEVRLGIELENAGRSLESYRQWIFENPATVRLGDGSDARHLGMEVYRQTVSGVGVGYLYDLGDTFDGFKLVYESPTSVIRDQTKFVLRDIPLP